MNHFGVGYAEDLKNGCNSHGEAIILNPSRRDTIIHYSIFMIHSNSKSLNRAINRNLTVNRGIYKLFSFFLLTLGKIVV